MSAIMVKNWWTTVIGLITGISTYLGGTGAKMPQNRAEWTNWTMSLGIVLLGLAAKDATTGSKPR
jgi:cytochrome b561